MLIDTHCHLYFDAFDEDREAVLARMRPAGVAGALLAGLDAPTSEQAFTLAAAHPELKYAAGLHPNSDFPAEVLAGGPFDAAGWLSPWWQRASAPVAVGECGLDLHWPGSPLAAQWAVFVAQLEYARERELPVIVHSRDADRETREALEAVPGARGVLHCFNGSPVLLDFIRQSAARGEDWYLSFAGNLTYPNAHELRQAAVQAPLDRLLVETDAPFLAPQSRRGRRCEPADVAETAAKLASLRQLPEEQLRAELAANACACFKCSW